MKGTDSPRQQSIDYSKDLLSLSPTWLPYCLCSSFLPHSFQSCWHSLSCNMASMMLPRDMHSIYTCDFTSAEHARTFFLPRPFIPHFFGNILCRLPFQEMAFTWIDASHKSMSYCTVCICALWVPQRSSFRMMPVSAQQALCIGICLVSK